MLLAAGNAFSQVDSAAAPAGTGGSYEDRMVTPELVGGGPSLAFASETPRTNYLHLGLTVGAGYDDNVFPGADPKVSDFSYSIWPSIALQQSRARLNWTLSYSPGFTFYQKVTERNEADHNFSANLEYRLSPHVTMSLRDAFTKSSSPFSAGLQNPGDPGSVPTRPVDIVPPLADRLSNIGTAGLSYQFAANGMIGASATFSNLYYPDLSQAPGLYNSSSKGIQGYYNHRLSGKHYIGATYQFQQLLSDPSISETYAHSVMFFYTYYLQTNTSLSFFGGPEHTETDGVAPTPLKSWSPGGGVSLAWQGVHTSLNTSFSRRISEGAGLSSAVRAQSAEASIRRLLAKHLTGSLSASYSDTTLLDTTVAGGNGHTISGTAALQQGLGDHLSVGFAYTRLHQNYSNIAALSANPDRNRYWFSLSYEFVRPLGR